MNENVVAGFHVSEPYVGIDDCSSAQIHRSGFAMDLSYFAYLGEVVWIGRSQR